MDLEDMDFTRAGNEIRRFKLVDAEGSFFNCAAMFQNAKSAGLQENYEVVVFFGTGRGPLGSSAGALHLMKDAVIVPLGRKFLAGTPKDEIVISEEK